MSYPAGAIKDQYEDAAQIGLRNACRDAEENYGLPPGVLLAVASRESTMENKVGDKGHGRGVFQIDDRYHHDWLSKHGAGAPGQVPPVRDAAFYAASLIAANIGQAKHAGVPKDDQLRVALAGYNAGMGHALPDYKAGLGPDYHTSGGDYSRDVLQRRQVVLGLLPDDGHQGNGKGDHDQAIVVGPTGGVQAPSGMGEKIVINPEHLRSMAGLLDRADDDFMDFAHRLATLRKPDMPHAVELQFASEIAGINVRLRALAPPAHTWAADLRRRASRVEEPAGPGTGRHRHHPVRYRHMLRIGSRGAQVRTLQRLLNRLGFGPLEVDGIFGPLTQAALKRFQASKRLEVDGVAGDKSWEALLGHPIRIGSPSAPSHPGGSGGGPVPEGFRGRLIVVIRSQVGTISQPGYNQANKYSSWADRGAEAWCADFVSWAFAHAGRPVGPGGHGYAAVKDWRAYFQGRNEWHSAPKVGAVVCFDWHDGGQTTDHVGIVSRIENGRVYYISGNTHRDPVGGPIGVWEKSVPLSNVLGYGY